MDGRRSEPTRSPRAISAACRAGPRPGAAWQARPEAGRCWDSASSRSSCARPDNGSGGSDSSDPRAGLLPAFWGRGYAIEAATAAASFAFEQLGWDAIGHVIDPANQASIVVARTLGSHLIGRTQLPEPYTKAHVDLWGQSRAEWRARHATIPARPSDGSGFTVSNSVDVETEAMIEHGLQSYNRSQVGPDPSRLLWVTCGDAGGRIIGGARCVVLWQWLLVDWLWIEEAHRRSGLGSDLLRRVEQAGLAEGCTGAMLNTFSFQAPDFYRSHGYAVFGELGDFPVRHTRYWMSKALAPPVD